MSLPSDPDLVVLHALRLKGFAELDVVAEMAGLPVDDVAARLTAFEADGLVRHREGKVSGWALTADGRADDERRLAAELDGAGARDAVGAAYRRFLEHNQAFLDVCTRWQMREVDGAPVLNEHRDPAYDSAVIGSLRQIDEAVQPICTDLAEVLGRFSSYGPRFRNALDAIDRGELDWFTKPTIDSYHTVWFELHENLMATLGIERGNESPT